VVGTPHDVLRTMQQRGEADVIVMGALARGRVAEFIVGNTAERVLHDASADVLLVAPRGSATNR
jgi:universal stress protein E